MSNLRSLFTKRKIALLAAAGVLALGLTAGMVMAQGDAEKPGAGLIPAKTFVDRVAENLGLDSDVVKEAFNKASRQYEDDRYQDRLNRMVENGRLSQEEADERYSWFQGRPDSLIQERRYGYIERDSNVRGKFGDHRRGRHGARGFRNGRHGGPPMELVPAVPPTPPAGSNQNSLQ